MTNLLYSAKHYQIKGSKEADRAKDEADRAKSYADSLHPETFVKTTGDQTIEGIKTFTSSIVLNRASNFIRSNNSDFNMAAAASTANGVHLQIQDYNGKASGLIENWAYTNGDKFMHIRCYSNVSGTQKTSQIGAGIRANGTIYTYAPNPAVSDNSTNIATTNYVNQKIQLVSALPSSPDANVFYFIPG